MIDVRNIDEATKHLYGQIASRCTHWMLKKDLELTSALVITPLMKTFHTIAKFGKGSILKMCFVKCFMSCHWII